MKTPYDAALRLRQRELDAMSEQIARVSGDLDRIGQQGAAVEEAIRKEESLVSGDYTLSAAAYFTRMRAQRAQLAQNAQDTGRALDKLRGETVETLGSLRAIESAVANYRTEVEREIARGEQATMDDTAAISFIKSRREWQKRRPR